MQEVLIRDEYGVIAQVVLMGVLVYLLCYYLRVRPLVLSSTLSQMWDRLNLPMLLFKVGLLTMIVLHYVYNVLNEYIVMRSYHSSLF